ncbi:hypothetical protein A3A66_03750 [Microgenomates group bacterium RIFCSPLOWO2_01_FULL_46_13]|nr:MAG: hypothetical protein A2783_00440 [Microgenomates group bacterium RIFCSPHIGHO2_01_FULL_45_11]OGV95195.1 MAG: hypothetical protein A3A66_03750 [Microgenomates group bacterium RIFCSPLOWO2_01_FULL_46_13]
MDVALTSSDQIRGSLDAKIMLLEYSDFQCPACKAYEPLVKKVLEEYSDEVFLVYRHFPLRQTHENAQLSAQAAEAAGKQQKFWEMHDLLFIKQEEWAEEKDFSVKLKSYAEELELNVDQFEKDLESDEGKRKIDEDYASGLKFNVNATPTFFLNGKKLENMRSFNDFKREIENLLR